MTPRSETNPPTDIEGQVRELQKRLDELTQKLSQRDAEIEKKDKEIKAMKAGKSGWLITAPNPLYDGKTAGIQFVNGQAFIPDDRVIDAFVRTPLKQHELEKYPLEEQIAIRERENLPSSQLAAEYLRDSFGYKIQHFDGDDESLKALMDQRAKERAELQAILDEQEEAKRSMNPEVFRTVARG